LKKQKEKKEPNEEEITKFLEKKLKES